MQKQTAFGIVVGTVLFIGLSVGAYFLLQITSGDSDLQKKPAVDVALKSTKPATENKQQSSTGLQVQGATTNTTPKTQQPLTPDEFSEYEQFATSETVKYQDTVVGTGKEAADGDGVAVVYTGWLTNGTIFDQTPKNELGQLTPIGFKLGAGQVIQGWEQGIFGMKEGGKRRLIIPAALGYGATRQNGIPPNAMLIFDVELVQVQKP